MKLKVDSRVKLFSYQEQFGTTTFLPDEFLVKDSEPDVIQTPGNVECTAITCCDIASDKDSVVYDYDDLFNRIPHTSSGASPQAALGETVKNGLLPVGQSKRIVEFSSYWSAHTGSLSPFDNVRSALKMTNYPVAIFTQWYSNWTPNLIMEVGQNPVSGHMYTIEGWKQINGVPMLQIEAWLGMKKFMPEDTFNKAIQSWGSGTAVLSTKEIDTLRKKTLLETIIDLCQNAILAINQYLMTQPKTPPEPQNSDLSPVPTQPAPTSPKHPIITDWANLIAKFEGANPVLNNPGNFKYSTLMASWGGQEASAGSDGGYFCKFSDYKTGFQALCNFLTLGCENQLIDYHKPPIKHPDVNPRTIKGFTLVYTNFPQPKYDYSDNLIKALGVTADTNVSTFL